MREKLVNPMKPQKTQKLKKIQERKDGLTYPATEKGENTLGRSAGSADPPLTTKVGVLLLNVFTAINMDT